MNYSILPDFISLHCPLTESTRGLICRESITKMKWEWLIINTGRGPLVNEQDMAEALQQGRVGAFCADVLAQEPPAANHPLFRVLPEPISPHTYSMG